MERRDERFLITRNIEHYERLLTSDLHHGARETVLKLLSEARHELLMHDREDAF
jgi:hypothetical protein